MRAGRLRHRLRLQQETTTQDDYGGIIRNWATTVTVWGAVEPISGKEFFEADQMNAEVTARVIIRYSSDVSGIDNNWRIEDANTGRKYDIVSVIEPQTMIRPGQMLELMVKRGETDDE